MDIGQLLINTIPYKNWLLNYQIINILMLQQQLLNIHKIKYIYS